MLYAVNRWQPAEASVSEWATVIDFVVTKGRGDRGDIAIDDVMFLSDTCQ